MFSIELFTGLYYGRMDNKVATTTIDAALVQKMFLAGARILNQRKNGLMT